MSDHNQLPGTGSIADSVEFVKKLWGIPSAGAIPGMLVPTLSLEEINKKIADLKAVESWMAVNMNMLRGTIQALEVQSATIINLQSMGAMMGAQQPDPKSAAAPAGASSFPFAFPGWPQQAAADSKPEAAPAPAAAPEPSPPPFEAAPAASSEPVKKSAPAPAAEPVAATANAWWDLLQNQFKQVVSTALMPDGLAAPGSKAKSVKPAKAATPKSSPSRSAGAGKSAPKTTVKKAPAGAKAKTPARPARKN